MGSIEHYISFGIVVVVLVSVGEWLDRKLTDIGRQLAHIEGKFEGMSCNISDDMAHLRKRLTRIEGRLDATFQRE